MPSPKPNILFIVKWFPFPEDRQFGVFTLKHAQSIADDVNLKVFHLCPMNVKKVRLVNDSMGGVDVLRLEYPRDWSVFNKTTKLQQYIKKAMKEVRQTLGEPDLVHVHILGMPVLIARYHFPKAPLIISEHWTGFVNGYFSKLPMWKQRWFKTSTQKAFITTVPSDNLGLVMKGKLGFPGKFGTLPNVIDVPPGLTLKQPPARIRALVVADMHDHNKNISGLLKAWKNCGFQDERLTIIGDGDDRPKLERLKTKLDFPDGQVEFLGRLDNRQVFDHLANASFLIVNSRFETFSMITTEALAAGIPVLATKSGGPEQFVNNSNGILIDKDAPEQLERALVDMIKMHRDFDREAISAEFREKYSSKNVGSMILDLYNQALHSD